MRTRKFGNSGPQVSVIGQGTWYIDRGNRESAVAALRRGMDLGMTHIDTAEMYGDAELVVAEAIAGRRDDIFLVSKVLPSNASRRGTLTACERSLARLKTDRLGCYLLHWRGSSSPGGTTAARRALGRGAAENRSARLLSLALARLVSAGGNRRRVRATGQRRQNPFMGCQQFRRRRSRRDAGGGGGG